VTPILLETGEHDSQQTPRRGIIDRPCAEGYRAHGCPGELFEVNDPGKHRERCDAHGCAQKEHCF
jgi:hypothetical protein